MIRLTDTIKHLLFINVIAFLVIHYVLPSFIDIGTIRSYTVLHTMDTGRFEPVQLVTSIFNHADFRHLLFNMLGLIFLGPHVENTLGPKRFLILYLAAGLISTLPIFLMTNSSVVGASGAVYGVIVAFAAMFPNLKLMLLFPPIPIKAKYMAMIILGYDIFFGFSGANTGIGHFAHIAGALTGLGLIIYWGKLNLR